MKFLCIFSISIYISPRKLCEYSLQTLYLYHRFIFPVHIRDIKMFALTVTQKAFSQNKKTVIFYICTSDNCKRTET